MTVARLKTKPALRLVEAEAPERVFGSPAPHLSPHEIQHILSYNKESGELTWLRRAPEMFAGCTDAIRRGYAENWNRRYAGTSPHLALDKGGYQRIRISKRFYLAHRLIWAIVYSRWPSGDVDHIDGCRSNNRFANLREVTKSENSRNAGIGRLNSSGALGVTFNRRERKWKASIQIDGVRCHLGTFDTKEEALVARQKAEHDAGYHPNHGKRPAFSFLSLTRNPSLEPPARRFVPTPKRPGDVVI